MCSPRRQSFATSTRDLYILRINSLQLLYFDAAVVKQNLFSVFEAGADESDRVLLAALDAGWIDIGELRRRGLRGCQLERQWQQG